MAGYMHCTLQMQVMLTVISYWHGAVDMGESRKILCLSRKARDKAEVGV